MKRTFCRLLVGLSCLLLFAASPAWADTTISKNFTNHTGVSANDFHWDLYGLYTIISTNAGQPANAFASVATSSDATDTYLDFTNGIVGNGNSTTIAVTVAGNNESERSANWTWNTINVGSAYDPMSYGSAYNYATTQWVVELDNKNILTAGRLLVQNLKFAVTNLQFNASTISSAGLTFGPTQSDFILEPETSTTFNIPATHYQFVVAEGDLYRVDAGGNIISNTEGHFLAEATPEPATLSLLALGGLAFLSRKRAPTAGKR
jgi:hypothetical protein